jgi:hypothetical protein
VTKVGSGGDGKGAENPGLRASGTECFVLVQRESLENEFKTLKPTLTISCLEIIHSQGKYVDLIEWNISKALPRNH